MFRQTFADIPHPPLRLRSLKGIIFQLRFVAPIGSVQSFVFGFEESCGYLIGSYVRDKDAVGAAMLICEMADTYPLFCSISAPP